MFVEFKPDALAKWNQLSQDERAKAISEGRVDITVTVEIKVEAHNQVLEEHKFYHVSQYAELLDGLFTVANITDQEATFYIGNEDEGEDVEDDTSMLVSVKVGEEKSTQVGSTPYITTYTVSVYDVSYGQVVEL